MSLLDKDFDLNLDEWKVKIKYYLDEYFSEVSKLVKSENIFINLSGEESWLYWKFDNNDNIQVYLSCVNDLNGRICNDGRSWHNFYTIPFHTYVTGNDIKECWEESV